MTFTRKLQLPFIVFLILLTGCHSVKWNSQNSTVIELPPENIQAIFNQFANGTMVLEANSPGNDYKYDIGEKDDLYGDNIQFRFTRVELKLLDKTPKGKLLVDISFVDSLSNSVDLYSIDLLRLTPKFDMQGDMVYPEIIEEEYNRFGYTFRKEHNEFMIQLSNDPSKELREAKNRAYRCQVVNNCLAPTKWEFSLISEDYGDFKTRRKGNNNLNQNKILSHSWFYLNTELYNELVQLKNPGFAHDLGMEYGELSNIAEDVEIDFEQLRNPIKYRARTEINEIGCQSKRIIEPLDNEQYYKNEFELFMEGTKETYETILETPVKTTQFKDAGYYTELTPKDFDLDWMRHLDSIHVDIINLKGTDAYAEITLTGQWTPYKINIGNIDLSLLSEQKLYGLLFGFNTYPKNRRYNPVQSTIAYDADLLPNDVKPYVLLTGKENDKWINNQYKGIEKIYLTYESMEKDVLEIYVLSYERITPVWMAKVKLPKDIQEKIRIRKGLYNY